MQRHMRKHVEGGYCPACNQTFRNLTHHLARNAEKDNLHMILYATIARITASNGKKLRALREKVIELLEIKSPNPVEEAADLQYTMEEIWREVDKTDFEEEWDTFELDQLANEWEG
jgi:hypothetical protein